MSAQNIANAPVRWAAQRTTCARLHADANAAANCTKYISDAFDTLSTISRVVARNAAQQLPQPQANLPPAPQPIQAAVRDATDDDVGTERSASTTHISASVAELDALPDLDIGAVSEVYSVQSGQGYDDEQQRIGNQLREQERREEQRVEQMPRIQQQVREQGVVQHPEQIAAIREDMGPKVSGFALLHLLLLIILLYAAYRTLFHADFEYQTHVIRSQYGLPLRSEMI